MNRLKRVSFVWGILPILLITMLLRTEATQASGAWKLIPGANPSATYDGLRGIAAVTTNDIWAVGAYSKTQNTHQPLIEPLEWHQMDRCSRSKSRSQCKPAV